MRGLRISDIQIGRRAGEHVRKTRHITLLRAFGDFKGGSGWNFRQEQAAGTSTLDYGPFIIPFLSRTVPNHGLASPPCQSDPGLVHQTTFAKAGCSIRLSAL